MVLAPPQQHAALGGCAHKHLHKRLPVALRARRLDGLPVAKTLWAAAAAPVCRRNLARPAALVGLMSDLHAADRAPRQSIDPQSSAVQQEEKYHPGTVCRVHSPEQFQRIQDENKGKLIVLMCKASHCRPCKMFGRKYSRMAERFGDSVLLEIMGDDSNETKKMMINMEVRVTPTFRMYRNGECVGTVTGTHESKLGRAIRDQLQPDEAGGNYCNLDERTEESDE